MAGSVAARAVQVEVKNSRIRLIRSDITELEVDAFVFYAQPDLALGSGFGGAIAVRGGPTIQKELDGLGPVETGQVAVSGAGNLKARQIIHAVGPRFNEEDTEGKLRTTVLNSLKAAEEKGAQTVAFPPMGTGFYAVPLDLSARVMLDTIKSYLEGETGLQEVVICVVDNREFVPFEAQLASLKS
jgi:O-acetyl-ADP-ribose deacetylase (regulator of RNase III)